jgi:RNA polymerase sigma-70 factor (ECF subfamily)
MSARSAAAWEPDDPPPAASPSPDVRLQQLAEEHFRFIWRSLRRLGVPPLSVDDATQQVFEVAARRLADLEPGREKAFLFKTALLVATDARRLAARSRARDGGGVDELTDPAPSPEDAALRDEKRLLLDRVLAALELEQRTVFVLYELEELEMADIAELLGIPRGTVASRLRRAREAFHLEVKRVRARLEFPGGKP